MTELKKMLRPSRRTMFAALLLLVAVPAPVRGQSTTGTILGTVRDQTRGVLPGVTVTIVNEGTNAQRVVATDAAGDYEATLLPPADYRVEAELQGFKKAVRSGIHLQVNQRARIEVTLEVGPVSEAVVVRADAPLVQSETAAVGTVVDNKKIVELPLNGRDFFQLAILVPGAAPPAEGSQNSTQGGAVVINGAREQSNNFLLDGIDNNDLAINQIVVPPSVDSVQEFKVQASTYSAEFGRSAGGQFNYVTKSGTNAWRGSAYEFFRNQALDSKNFFDLPDQKIPEFHRNQFGGTIGGPLQRNKLFLFGNYEGTRINQAFTRIATVPPLAWVNGDFSSLLTGSIDPATHLDRGQLIDPRTGLPVPGNLITPALQDPAGAAIVKFYPAPDNRNARGPSTATVSPIGRTNDNKFTLKIDHSVSERTQMFYRYSFWDEDRFNPFDPLTDPTNVPGFGSFTRNRGQSLAIGWTRTIGARAMNDFRFGFNRLNAGIFQEHQGEDVAATLGITGLPGNPRDLGRPGIVLGITDALVEPTNAPQDRRDNTLQFTDSFTWLKGAHSLKVGADVRRFELNVFIDILARGQFIFVGRSGNPVADLLMGTPFVGLRQNPASKTDGNIRTTSVNGYVQDDWKIGNDLTANLGLRYEYNQPPYDTQNRFSVPDFSNPNGGFLQAGQNSIPSASLKADKNNLAPRFGIAWKPFHSSDTVVRGGYGIFYDATLLNAIGRSRLNPPFFNLDILVRPGPLRNFFSGNVPPLPLLLGHDYNYREPAYQEWSFGVQRELRPNLVLDVGYVGSKGRNLVRTIDTNQGPPGGPPYWNPNFGPAEWATWSGVSDYRALQVRLERRFVGGLSVLSAYTWSRSRDDSSALFGSHASGEAPQNSSNPRADYGPSDFDSPHRWVTSYIWELPFGRGKSHLSGGGLAAALLGNWELAGILTMQSGRPFTVQYSTNYSGTNNGDNGGNGYDRPNQIGNPNPAHPDPALWFNPAAFTPPKNTFGTVGRNTLRGDGVENLDFAIYRNVSLPRGRQLQVRVEVFNALNHPFFFLPIADLNNANAGKVTRAGDSRQIQLGTKVTW